MRAYCVFIVTMQIWIFVCLWHKRCLNLESWISIYHLCVFRQVDGNLSKIHVSVKMKTTSTVSTDLNYDKILKFGIDHSNKTLAFFVKFEVQVMNFNSWFNQVKIEAKKLWETFILTAFYVNTQVTFKTNSICLRWFLADAIPFSLYITYKWWHKRMICRFQTPVIPDKAL